MIDLRVREWTKKKFLTAIKAQLRLINKVCERARFLPQSINDKENRDGIRIDSEAKNPRVRKSDGEKTERAERERREMGREKGEKRRGNSEVGRTGIVVRDCLAIHGSKGRVRRNSK